MKRSLEQLKKVGVFLLVFMMIASSIFSQVTYASKKTAEKTYIAQAKKAIRMQNLRQAYDFYFLASELGNAEAQYQLSNILNVGSGVEADPKKGRKWLQKSANQNFPPALYKLAIDLSKKNAYKAEQLMGLAAELGFSAAKHYMARNKKKHSRQGINLKSDKHDLWFGAARLGDIKTLELLKEQGVDVDRKDGAGRTALFVAVEFERANIVSWLLKRKADVNHVDNFGNTVLFIAVGKGNTEIFTTLSEANANLEHALNNGNTLWHSVASKENNEVRQLSLVIQALINRKADINQKNVTGWTPLDIAEYKEHKVLAQKMKLSGAKNGDGWFTQLNDTANTTIKQYYSALGNTLVDAQELAKVISSGNVTLFNALLSDNPLLLQSVLDDGRTLLAHAVHEGEREIVQTLLALGANPNASDENGVSALHVATKSGNLLISKDLLGAKADPDNTSNNGMDAMDWAIDSKQDDNVVKLFELFKSEISKPYQRYLLAASKNNMTSTVRFLLSEIDFEVADSLGRTGSWYGAYHQNIKMLEALSKITDKNKTDNYGKTPFYVAIEQNCFECIKYLFTPQNINKQSDSGDSPLIVASANGNKDIVRWLLAKNADVEIRNELGNTALICATENNELAIVKDLVDSNASISRKNHLGFSALDVAKGRNKSIYSYLKENTVFGIF